MEDLLTPVSQVYKTSPGDQSLLQQIKSTKPPNDTKKRTNPNLSTFEEALEALKNEPDYDTLSAVLTLLNSNPDGTIHIPTPQNAQIIQALVAEIVPNYWRLLKDEATPHNVDVLDSQDDQSLPLYRLLSCLRSISGVNAVLARLRALLGDYKVSTNDAQRSHVALNLEILLELLCSLLDGHDTLPQMWRNSSARASNESVTRLLGQEFVNLVGGGKIVSLAAEAESKVPEKKFWATSSKEYSIWLAANIVAWVQQQPPGIPGKLISDLLVKAFRLGQFDLIIKHLVGNLLLKDSESGPDAFERLFQELPQYEQKRVLCSVLKYASDAFFDSRGDGTSEADGNVVGAVAGLVNSIVRQVEARRKMLVAWLADSTGAAPGEPVGIRRVVVAVLAQNRDDITLILEKSLNQFGDQLYVRHAPLLQQDAHVQVLLLAAGYVHRISPIKLALLVKSSSYLSTVSSRLSAPQTKARILGMVVGEALSALTQSGNKALSFNMDELKTEEAMWYKSLVNINDIITSPEALHPRLEIVLPTHEPMKPSGERPETNPKRKPQSRQPKAQQVAKTSRFVIEEVDDSEGEDDDLVPYGKPDSDPDDSEDDAELVTRNKPRAPVYVRDLIAYLRDTENYDRQHLALTTAPVLIRRKANYGTEVKEHAEELATLLVGLQDKFNIEDFYELKIQGMIAIVVAQPQKMGPWFGKTFFDGDYSLSQRASVLTVLGLAARELVGLEKSNYSESAAFPSKKLPEKVEQLYLDQPRVGGQNGGPSLKALHRNALDDIAQTIKISFLAPMVASAADATTGPEVLKLSSFTSRLQQGAASAEGQQRKKKPGVRAIANTTAQLISTSFFFPLTARFQAALSSSSTRGRNIVLQPELLAHLLRTLGLLVHAAGPSTLALPDMTAELWRLLLGPGVQGRCAGDLGVTRAALFTLLTLLEVNGEDEGRMRDICRELAREVVETQEWVALVFDGTRGGDGEAGEENDQKLLAAGVLIRLRETMERYRAFLLGNMIG